MPTTSTLSTRTSAGAVVNLFAYNGLVIGVYAASLAALRERLGLDTSWIAGLLVAAGVSAIAAMQVGGRLTDRIGARRIALTCLPRCSPACCCSASPAASRCCSPAACCSASATAASTSR